MAVAITRQELSAGELQREAARTRDAKAARRMLAIALVLEGRSREDAAEGCGMDRQTLRDWAHRDNAEGLAGLADSPRRNGPKPRLPPGQEAAVAEWAEQGSNPVEQVWACLRANFLSHRVWGSYEAIVDACRGAWKRLMNTPGRLASMTRRAWARAVTG